MRVVGPRIKETTTTIGTGTLSLDGAVAGFQTFVAGVGDLQPVYYTIIEGNNWEVGIGTVTDGTPDTLSRTTILGSSNAGAALNLAGGTKEVFCDLPAQGISEVASSSRGQTSKNNATTPNTQFDLIAATVTVRNAQGATVTLQGPATVTNTISSDHTNPNARDQAGAFSSSSWIHFYWVWGPTVGLRSRSSVTAPPTGPALQSGETHWAYATAARLDGSTNLLKIYCAGAWTFYQAGQSVLSNGTATTETAVSLSGFVPPNALTVKCKSFLAVGSSSAVEDIYAALRLVTGVQWILVHYVRGSTAVLAYETNMWEIPNIAQNLFYLLSSSTNSKDLDIDVLAFKNPNGGD